MSGKKDGFRSSGSTSKCSKVLLAVSFGILLGLLLAFLYPHGVLHPSSSSVEINHWQVATCGSPERVKLLKSELQSMSETNAKLRRQIKELTMKVQQVEQGRDNAQQAALMNAKVKAGPFGTVKSTRTNPTVIPDESVNPTLAQLLKKVAVNNELIVALANSNIKDMLEVWADSIKHVGISNYLVVALDDQMAEYCKSKNIPVYRRDPLDEKSKKVGKEGGNHAVSALKFQMLREFLQLGYSVLLSDIDIVYVQNPFKFLHRDCDVESMSDGHTNQTAYGYNDVFDDPPMGWARFAHTMRIWVYNSGFFYIRPTVPSIELLDRVADRLSKENAWDQAVFNEVLFFPSHPGYVGLHASRRTMDYYLFLNSKVLFTRLRNDPEMAKFKPVVVHINYHPNKLPRMKAVVEYYVEGNKNALKRFPDGSEWI